jgi:hypothetical protein
LEYFTEPIKLSTWTFLIKKNCKYGKIRLSGIYGMNGQQFLSLQIFTMSYKFQELKNFSMENILHYLAIKHTSKNILFEGKSGANIRKFS